MNKKRNAIIVIIILSVIAIFIFLESPMMSHYTSISFGYQLLLFLGVFILSLTIHEASHALAFKIQGVPLRAIMILLFVWMKKDKQWHLTIKPKMLLLGGGIVVPNIPPIEDEDHLKRMQKKLANALLAAPVVSIVFGLLGGVIGATLAFTSDNTFIASLFFALGNYALIFAILFTLVSLVDAGSVVGDYPAYRKTKNDTLFVASMLYDYQQLSETPLQTRRANTFLRNHINDLLIDLPTHKTNLRFQAVLHSLLIEYIIDETSLMPAVETHTEALIKRRYWLLRSIKEESGLALTVAIIYYLYKHNRDEEAIQLFEEVKQRKTVSQAKKENKVVTYYLKQAEHILGLDNHQVFLQDRRNIQPTALYWIMAQFEGFYHDEEALNKGVKKKQIVIVNED